MSKLFTGAEIVFKALEDQKVDYIFGYPGGAVLPIYDELKNHKSIINVVCTVHTYILFKKYVLAYLSTCLKNSHKGHFY